MSNAANIQKWKMFVKGTPTEIGVAASDAPDSVVGGASGQFSIFDPLHSVRRPGGAPLAYFKGSIVAAPPGLMDGATPVQPGVYGATADIPISGGMAANFPNFPESLQSQPNLWDFLFYLPVKTKTCGANFVWVQRSKVF